MPGFARVLVVDDDVDERYLLGALLKRMGHDTVLAESGEAALRHLDRDEFDLAITTVDVRGMEGMNFGKLLQGVRSGVPIVLLAGQDDRVEASLESGMTALLRPVSPETVEDVVSEILARQAGRKRPRT